MQARFLMAAFLYTLVLSLSACQSSVDVLRKHWHELNEIADAHKEDCVTMGLRLGAYLEDNDASLRHALSQLGTAKAHEAKELYITGKTLDDATAHCKTPEMEAFRLQFAKMTIESIPLEVTQGPSSH